MNKPHFADIFGPRATEKFRCRVRGKPTLFYAMLGKAQHPPRPRARRAAHAIVAGLLGTVAWTAPAIAATPTAGALDGAGQPAGQAAVQTTQTVAAVEDTAAVEDAVTKAASQAAPADRPSSALALPAAASVPAADSPSSSTPPIPSSHAAAPGTVAPLAHAVTLTAGKIAQTARPTVSRAVDTAGHAATSAASTPGDVAGSSAGRVLNQTTSHLTGTAGQVLNQTTSHQTETAGRVLHQTTTSQITSGAGRLSALPASTSPVGAAPTALPIGRLPAGDGNRLVPGDSAPHPPPMGPTGTGGAPGSGSPAVTATPPSISSGPAASSTPGFAGFVHSAATRAPGSPTLTSIFWRGLPATPGWITTSSAAPAGVLLADLLTGGYRAAMAAGRSASPPGSSARARPPAPAGGLSSAAGSASGFAFSILLTLAGLMVLGAAWGRRRLRLASEPWPLAPFVLIPERPG